MEGSNSTPKKMRKSLTTRPTSKKHLLVKGWTKLVAMAQLLALLKDMLAYLAESNLVVAR